MKPDVSPFDALGDSGLRKAFLFVRARPAAVTAAEAAEALALPVSVARWRLEKLASARLLEASFERRAAGRPAKTYRAAAETHQIELPRRRYEKLASLLLHALPQRRRTTQLHEVGVRFGKELAASAGVRRSRARTAGLEALCRGLGKLGFQASLEAVSADGAEIVSATCPLRPIVAADPDARAIDEGMWAGLIEAAVGAACAECRTDGCLEGRGSCRIAVFFSGQSAA